jgi:hypothetical protein
MDDDRFRRAACGHRTSGMDGSARARGGPGWRLLRRPGARQLRPCYRRCATTTFVHPKHVACSHNTRLADPALAAPARRAHRRHLRCRARRLRRLRPQAGPLIARSDAVGVLGVHARPRGGRQPVLAGAKHDQHQLPGVPARRPGLRLPLTVAEANDQRTVGVRADEVRTSERSLGGVGAQESLRAFQTSSQGQRCAHSRVING